MTSPNVDSKHIIIINACNIIYIYIYIYIGCTAPVNSVTVTVVSVIVASVISSILTAIIIFCVLFIVYLKQKQKVININKINLSLIIFNTFQMSIY